jgi:hypothetical protein
MLILSFCLYFFCLYFRFLNASFNSVCLLVNATGRPSINKYFMWERISSRSPSVTTRLAILPASIDPSRSATFKICAGIKRD